MPTLKQKRAFKIAGENGGNIMRAMEMAGYAPSVIHATEKLTKSKGWNELMEQHFPDKMLAKKHHEGLNAVSKKPHLVDRDDKGRPVYEYIPETDFDTRYKYLDSAYKLKRKYPKEGIDNTNNILIVNISQEIAEKNKIQTNGKELV